MPIDASAEFLFKTLNSTNGLNSSQINCIHKDSRGFMWFGTSAGLYRYDGYTFKAFQSNSQDGASLPDSYINNIYESLNGDLWILTASGLCIYHPQNETFERDMRQVFAKIGIKDQPSVMFIDSHKNLWLAIPEKGVFAYNMQQQLTYEFGYTNDALGIPEGEICSIGECRDGALIVYEDGRIACCSISNQQQTLWVANDVANQKLRKSASLKVFADQMDNIWLYGKGTLMIYNKKIGQWNTTIGNSIGLTNVSVDHAVNAMAADRNGNIWIGTDRSGLIRTNVNSYEMEYIDPRNMNDMHIRRDIISIQSLYVDDTDLLWVGTEKAGVAFWSKNIYKFQSELNGDITAVTQDAEGKLWYGTSDKGVIGYDGPLASLRVSAITTTKDGSLWVGSKNNGLTRIKDGVATIYSVSKDSLRTVINDHINALCTDKAGNLWIATSGGLQVFNPRLNSFSTYTKENRKLNTNNITALHFGKGNNIFIGTGEGLIIMNLSSTERYFLTGNKSNLKTFTNNYITQIYEDSRGLIWIGTREGINILNPTNDHLDHLTERVGLCNNNICGITEDKYHNIWVSTSNGISRVVVQRDHEMGTYNYGLYNYDTSDGLQSNEFNVGAIFAKTDGNVVFGGLFGVNWINREGKKESESLPRVMLTQLFINEEEIQVGHRYDDNVPLQQALNESSKIVLNNNQNTFTIKFGAGNYNQSERLLFMYWLEGKDNDWRNGDALTHGVTFNELSSGSYKLHVKAVSSDGAISNQERTLEIRILPPWWLSWWMLLFYAIILMVAVYLWRFGYQKISYLWKKKKAVLTELKIQREEIKSASDDLRQPMSRMTSIISTLSEKEDTVEGKEQINSLHFQMLQIITRLSEMQIALEKPESKAANSAANRLQLNDEGIICLPNGEGAELTAEIKNKNTDLATMKYVVMIIDDNDEFLKFISAHLYGIYNTHAYNNIDAAIADIDVLKANVILCKQDMPKMTGSEFCNRLKTSQFTDKIKFILMTDTVLTPQDMEGMNITLSADDYLAKPFNIQEAIIRINNLLGIVTDTTNKNVIEGKETRRLESLNASMTTVTTSYDDNSNLPANINKPLSGDNASEDNHGIEYFTDEDVLGNYSMNDFRDRQLIKNIEQYVIHNMSRGQISLEEMASAMGMGRVPFFHKIRSITNMTPTELVRELRLKHACTLLIRTNINLTELAINVGFMTAENFTKIFKDRFGMSPIEYRLTHRNK